MKTLSITCAVTALLSQLYAQEPASPPAPGVPAPAEVQANDGQPVKLPPGLGAGNPAQAAKANERDMQAIFYTADEARNSPQNTLAEDVGTLYFKLTGKDVIIPKALAEIEFTLRFRGPLTYEQTLKRLQVQIETEGYTFVPFDDELVKLLPKSQGRGASAPENGVKFVHSIEDLPKGDEFVTYVMRLDYLKPEEAQRTFNAMVGPLSSGGKITPIANASSIAITEKTSLIRYLLILKEKIDVPSTSVGSKWVKLIYADAEQVVQQLDSIMNAKPEGNTTAGVANVNVNPSGGTPPPIPGLQAQVANNAGGAAAPSAAGETIPIQLVAEPRNNRIFMRGSPADIIFAEGLVAEFDAKPEDRNFLKRKLQFVAVADFMSVAADAIDAITGTPAQSGQGGQGGATRGGSNNNRSATTSNRGTGGSGGSGGGTGGLSDPSINSAPESLQIGKTLLVANNVENSIIVKGPPQSIRIVDDLINELDGRPRQVMISTVFGQLQHVDDTSLGIDFVKTLNANTGNVGGSLKAGDVASIGLDTLAEATGFASSGLSLFARVSSDFNTYVRAAKTNSQFTVLSRPTVFTTNNSLAVISSGQRVPVPSQSFESTASGQTTNIEYRDVVLRLEVVPLINSEDEVTLEIYLLNDELLGGSGNTITIDDNPISTIATRELVTKVTVRNNETVVLGGLIRETNENSWDGIPILSDIPGLGKLFSSKSKVKTKDELLIFIQPSILGGDKDSTAFGFDETRRYNLTDDALKMANGAVLPAKNSIPAEIVSSSSNTPANPTAPQPSTQAPVEEQKSLDSPQNNSNKSNRINRKGSFINGMRRR